MGSREPSILSLIVLRVEIGPIRQVFVGFEYHAEQEYPSVVLLSVSCDDESLEVLGPGRTWFMYTCYDFFVEGQVE